MLAGSLSLPSVEGKETGGDYYFQTGALQSLSMEKLMWLKSVHDQVRKWHKRHLGTKVLHHLASRNPSCFREIRSCSKSFLLLQYCSTKHFAYRGGVKWIFGALD